jgi:hypothetical protein
MSKQEQLLTYWSELSSEAQDQLLEIAQSLVSPPFVTSMNLPELGQSQSGRLQEAQWIDVINQRLSVEEQRRLDDLRDRAAAGTIREDEHQELLAWIDRVEARDVERANAMIQLARLRGVDLDVVVAEFLPRHVGV